ncbi:MAG: hypothetical protein PHT39_00850 [Sphaerochaetaceae bacterium]|nr:hypothetical protein [Sphaerochaetaceae bacterium]
MKRFAFALILLAMLAMPLFAATDYYHSSTGARVFYAPSVSADGGATFTVPLSEEFKQKLQFPRTSWNATLNLSLLSVQIGTTEVHTGPFARYVSDSITYGRYKVDSRLEIGYSIMAVMHLSKVFSLGAGYQIGVTSTLAQMDVKWASHSIEIRPEFSFRTTVQDQFQIVIPIRATYAYDYLGVNVSVGFRWLHSKIMETPLWVLEQEQQNKNKSTRNN